jgi:hypothetical protein
MPSSLHRFATRRTASTAYAPSHATWIARLVACGLLAGSGLAFAACSSGDDTASPEPDAAKPERDGGPEGGGGPGDGVVEDGCPAIPPKSPPGATDVCAVEKGAGGAVLYVGDVLRPGKVTTNGQVLVDPSGTITCVGCDCAAKAPDATKVICPDAVVSPGLINAHDHGGWVNGSPALPTKHYLQKAGGAYTGPQDPVSLRFEHRNDWRPSGNTLSPKIDEPGGQATADQKIYGDVRMALGGAVMSFISSSPAKFLRIADDAKKGFFPATQAFAKYETFPIGSSIQIKDDPTNPDCAKYQFKAPPAPGLPWIPHVSEGIDVDARNEFLCLTDKVAKGKNYLDGRSAIIHGVGLTTADVAVMAEKGVKLVWSPRSNISLYGETARVTEFDRLGVPIGLGTDWLPSGSMNMLRELTCADDFNRTNLGGYFSDEKLWRMATKGSAQALGFDAVTGELAEGKTGDLAIFAKAGRKGFRAVISATEKETALVVRSGKVLVGSSAVVAALEASCDELEICGVKKRVCTSRDTGKSWDAIGKLTGQYTLASCGQTPPDEPTCLPARTLDTDKVNQSTAFAGTSNADDIDGDGIPNAKDNCPTIFNPARPLDKGAQENSDGDALGDACDPCPFDKDTTTCSATGAVKLDVDGDGTEDKKDNCPNLANPGQQDADTDGFGDACDPCPSAAGASGGCPLLPRKIDELWTLGDDVDAKIENVCVSVLRPTTRIWIQDPAWTTARTTSGGLFVFTGNGTSVPLPNGLAARDLITIEGKTTTYKGTFQLTDVKAITIVQANSAQCDDATLVKTVTLGGISPGGADEAKYRFMLVKLLGLTSSGPDSTSGATPSRFGLQGSTLKVTNFVAGTAAFNGTTFPNDTALTEVVGVLDYFNANQLAPRARADIKP